MAKNILHFLLIVAFFHTIIATDETWKINLSAKINGPTADQVWPYIYDFCNLYKILPNRVSFCDQGAEGEPGLTRYSLRISPSPTKPNLTVVTDWVREELVEVSVTEKYSVLEMRENTRGVTMMRASMQVLPSGNKGCILKWDIVLAPIARTTYELFYESLEVRLSDVVAMILTYF